MIAFAATITSERLEFQMIPAKALTNRSGSEDCSLHAMDRHHHIGQGEQASPPPESRLTGINPVQAKAIFADEGTDDAAAQADGNEREKRADRAGNPGREAQAIDHILLPDNCSAQYQGLKKSSGQQEIEILGDGT